MSTKSNIVFVTNVNRIPLFNAIFFIFFDVFKYLAEFTQHHHCICEFFEVTEEEGYIYNYSDREWVEVVYRNPRASKVKIKKNNHFFIFNVKVAKFNGSSYVINFDDITQLEEYKRELELKRDTLTTQLYTDNLTLLPNRMKLIEDIKCPKNPIIILINIDRFKEINDFYGVEIGDYVLKEFAKIINTNLPSPTSRLYKMSGDEYIILDDRYIKRLELIKMLNQLSNYLNSQTIIKEGYEISISTTMGVSHDTSDLLISADLALREAKRTKLRFALYDKSFATLKQYENNLLWSKKIKQAIFDRRIVPYFQPIVDNKTHKIVKYETLVRLISQDDQVIPPMRFLPIAKQSRIYHNISLVMIQDSFKYFAQTDMSFSINISINDIENYETHQFILEQLQKYHIGNRVTFEILESEGIDNYTTVSSFIQEIKAYDAKIAIDDFGTGYSNFNHIINLHVDFLKIDGSLINNMLHDESLRIVVETIVDFAKKLGIKTIAEFVDSKELYEYVCAIGIDYSQGFYIAQPSDHLLPSDYHFYEA